MHGDTATTRTERGRHGDGDGSSPRRHNACRPTGRPTTPRTRQRPVRHGSARMGTDTLKTGQRQRLSTGMDGDAGGYGNDHGRRPSRHGDGDGGLTTTTQRSRRYGPRNGGSPRRHNGYIVTARHGYANRGLTTTAQRLPADRPGHHVTRRMTSFPGSVVTLWLPLVTHHSPLSRCHLSLSTCHLSLLLRPDAASAGTSPRQPAQAARTWPARPGRRPRSGSRSRPSRDRA